MVDIERDTEERDKSSVNAKKKKLLATMHSQK